MKVELLSFWGDDLTVVNNARVSFDKQSTLDCVHGENCCQQPNCYGTLRHEDARLIGYLARGCTLSQWNELILELQATGESDRIIEILQHVKHMPEHWAPFANGVGMRFRIKAPIPIMRQLFKHKIGSVESEVSRRYVDDAPEFFVPEWRERADNVKQGSSNVIFHPEPMPLTVYKMDDMGFNEVATIPVDIDWFYQFCADYYAHLLEQDTCPEQARFVLPQGAYTEAIISNSLYGWARVFNQRSDRSHAQREIADIVDMIGAEAAALFPVSWKSLTK